MEQTPLINTTPNDMVKFELSRMLDNFMSTIVSELKHTNSCVARLEQRIDKMEGKLKSQTVNNDFTRELTGLKERMKHNQEYLLRYIHKCCDL